MKRMSFRTRLGLIITIVFIAAGAGLLAVQYFVVQQLFTSAISMTAATCVEGAPVTLSGDTTLTGCSPIAEVTDIGGEFAPVDGTYYMDSIVGGAVLQQSAFLSDEVSGGLLLWSIVMLIVFAGVAAAIAFWLARKSLDRIGEVTAAARDISERDLGRRLDLPGPDDEIKELGDTIDGMLDRLELAFAAQDRFVANASHELRTPLTTTRTALEIPLEQGTVPEDLQPNVRRALRATEQSERLITALLSLARSRVGVENGEPVDLADVVEAQFEGLATRDVTVHVALEPAPTTGDAVLLSRAVRNLLDNGIRHNAVGGELWVRCRYEGDYAVVEVENTGPHIPAETLALLTEPFFRGDASRTSAGDRDGVGLGLAIVQSIATTHGGDLQLISREGGGLVARLRLPA